jgi:hypothetical protein
MSNTARLGVLAAVIVVAIAGFVIANSGGSGSDAPKTATVTIDVKNGKPVGGVKKIKLKEGGTLNLTVNSDTADEVHVHATNQHEDVKKGGSIHMVIKPTGTGASEIELEEHKEQLAELSVEP